MRKAEGDVIVQMLYRWPAEDLAMGLAGGGGVDSTADTLR